MQITITATIAASILAHAASAAPVNTAITDSLTSNKITKRLAAEDLPRVQGNVAESDSLSKAEEDRHLKAKSKAVDQVLQALGKDYEDSVYARERVEDIFSDLNKRDTSEDQSDLTEDDRAASFYSHIEDFDTAAYKRSLPLAEVSEDTEEFGSLERRGEEVEWLAPEKQDDAVEEDPAPELYSELEKRDYDDLEEAPFPASSNFAEWADARRTFTESAEIDHLQKLEQPHSEDAGLETRDENVTDFEPEKFGEHDIEPPTQRGDHHWRRSVDNSEITAEEADRLSAEYFASQEGHLERRSEIEADVDFGKYSWDLPPGDEDVDRIDMGIARRSIEPAEIEELPEAFYTKHVSDLQRRHPDDIDNEDSVDGSFE